MQLTLSQFMLQEQDCDICGVEIVDGALAVDSHPFKRSTAFLVGNEVQTVLYVTTLCYCSSAGRFADFRSSGNGRELVSQRKKWRCVTFLSTSRSMVPVLRL